MKFHEENYRHVTHELASDADFGLGQRQADELLQLHGYNQIEEKKGTSLATKFFMQFNDFMIMILLAAAGISLWVSWINGERDFLDPLIILMIVILNAILGVVQENKAEKSLEALKKMSSPTAKALRDGNLLVINTDLLVPGDIIILETGDFVPADARLISSSNLRAEESALTGESIAAEKDADYICPPEATIGDRKNMVFAGSSISYGHGKAIITATGMNTEVGRIAHMILNDEAPDTPLQKRLAETGKMLGLGALGICLLIFLLGLIRHIPMFEMFMTSVSLAVAAIPEGLPAIVTIMLAIGVQRMAKKNAIIRKLPAVETLGSASVICSDKTGTLTQNKMTIVEVRDSKGILGNTNETKKRILRYATLCNDSIYNEPIFSDSKEKSTDGKRTNQFVGDPTETAILLAALNLGINKKEIDRRTPRVGEVPFDSKRKMMSTVHQDSDGYIVITKGAPEMILEKCRYYDSNGETVPMSSTKYYELLSSNSSMADKALRVLAVGYKKINQLPSVINDEKLENNLIFIGLLGMMDPPREEVKQAVETCKTAGITPVMVTGDHVVTAKAIARKLGIMDISDKAITGEELSRMPQDELNGCIKDYKVFARVSPEHKMRIVKAFQYNGAVVAMTGDGVNDAPALKAADIGCAMGISGTDVAKSAADMVLTDDNFATIVDAVREGRGIYSNIRKAVHFLLSSNIGEIITIFIAILLGWNTPLLAIHLLWVNLVTDSLPAIALGLDPAEKDVMQRRPYDNHKSLFSDGLFFRIAAEGIMIGMLALLAYGIGNMLYGDVGNGGIGRTMTFATLSISQLVHAFNMRSEKSLFTIDVFENVYLVGAFICGLALQVSVIMIEPLSKIFKVQNLSAAQWLIVAFLCVMPLIIVELQKLLTRIEDNRGVYKLSEQHK